MEVFYQHQGQVLEILQWRFCNEVSDIVDEPKPTDLQLDYEKKETRMS